MNLQHALSKSILAATLALAALPGPRAEPGAIGPGSQHLEGAWSGTSTSTVNAGSGVPPSTQPFHTTFHRDGTLLFVPSSPAQSVGVGEWVRIGDRQFAYTHTRFAFDENRRVSGMIRVRATLQLHEGMQTLSGQLKADILDTSGGVLRTAEGTFQARRLPIEAS